MYVDSAILNNAHYAVPSIDHIPVFTRLVTLSSISLSDKPACVSIYLCTPLRLQPTNQRLALLLAELVSGVDFGLGAGSFAEHDGRVRVVLLHRWVGAGKEGSEISH